jgi:putative ABC transport system permease protein
LRKKFLLGALGIGIAIALLTSIIAVTDTIQQGLVDAAIDEWGGVDAVVLPREEGRLLTPPQGFEPGSWSFSLRTIEKAKSLRAVIIGLDLVREKSMGIKLAKDLDIGEGGCAVTTVLADELDLDVGDYLEEIEGIGELRIDEVVRGDSRAIYLNSSPLYEGNVSLVKFNDREELYTRSPGEIVKASKELGEDVRSTDWFLGQSGSYEVLVVLPIAQALRELSEGMSYLTAMLIAVAAISLIVASVLIFSLISIRAEEREREFAIYRAIGKRKRGIFMMVIGESLAMSLVGAIIGAALGLALSSLLSAALSLPINLKAPLLIIPVSVGIVAGIISGLYPAYSSSRKEIAQSLDPHRRGYRSGKVVLERGQSNLLIGIGSLISFLSIFILFVMPALSIRGGEVSMLGMAVVLLVSMVVGLALIGVGGLAPLIERGLSKLVRALSPGVGATADTYVKRHRRRNSTTSVMFSIAICFTVFISSVYAMQYRSFDVTISYENGADCVVYSPEGLPEDFIGELRGLEGIESISFVTEGEECTISDDIRFEEPVNCVLYGVDENLLDTLYPDFVEMEGDLRAIGVIIPRSVASYLGVGLLDNIRIESGDGFREKRVFGIASSLPGFPTIKKSENRAVGAAILEPTNVVGGSGREVERALIKFKESSQTAKLIKEMRAYYPYDPITITVTSEEVEEAKEASGFLLSGLWAILILSVLIAFFGLVASSYVSVRESGFEIGVLRSLGIRGGSIGKMFMAEAMIVTLSASVSGTVMGTLVGWVYGLQQRVLMELPLVSALPSASIVVGIILMSAILGPIATTFGTRGLVRRNPADILRNP